MTIDRRSLIGGAGLAVLVPSLPFALPIAAKPSSPEKVSTVVVIDGWSAQDGAGTEDQVLIKVGHGWRAVWR